MLSHNLPLSRFFVRFLCWTLLLQLMVWQLNQSPGFSSVIEQFIAWFVASLYGFFFDDMLLAGNHLIHKASARYVIVDQQCTALVLVASLMAGIFSLPHKRRNKIAMILIAVAVIQVENAFRIMHLYYEMGKKNNQFEFYHLYVWQLINFIMAVCLFFFLDRAFQKKEFNLGS